MKNNRARNSQTAHRFLLMVCLVAVAAAFAVARPHAAYADDEIVVPDVPDNLEVPAGHKVFLEGHAIGTQAYICLPSEDSESGFSWTFFGPQATLFNDHERQIITHFLSPNLDEKELPPRATWQDSRDTSTIWAMAVADAPSPVEPRPIPWLLLKVVGAEPGPTGGQRLTRTMYIQRLNTWGGIAPSSADCTEVKVGQKALVPYTADYFFYKSTKRE